MTQDEIMDLFNEGTRTRIQQETSWADEDTWILGPGLKAVYVQRTHTFVVYQRGTTLGTVSLDLFLPKKKRK